MNQLEELQHKAYLNGLNIHEFPLSKDLKGLIFNKDIALNESLSYSEKIPVLAEEINHYLVNVPDNILDLKNPKNAKEELKARRKTYYELLSAETIKDAVAYGVDSPYEFADYCDLSVSFVLEAFSFYIEYCGGYLSGETCEIQFSPYIKVIEKES